MDQKFYHQICSFSHLQKSCIQICQVHPQNTQFFWFCSHSQLWVILIKFQQIKSDYSILLRWLRVVNVNKIRRIGCFVDGLDKSGYRIFVNVKMNKFDSWGHKAYQLFFCSCYWHNCPIWLSIMSWQKMQWKIIYSSLIFLSICLTLYKYSC